MRLTFPGIRGFGDNRFTLLRFETSNYVKGGGWKASVSLHRKLFYWRKEWRELRFTLLGSYIHFRRN